jgi:hypothetical protein
LEAGYGARRHPIGNEVWERLSASMIAAGKPLPQKIATTEMDFLGNSKWRVHAHLSLRKHPEEWTVQLEPKDVTCACGYVTTLTNKKLMCIKCGKYVFYNEDEKRLHRRQTLYVTLIIALALGFVVYFFVELVLGPLLLLIE